MCFFCCHTQINPLRERWEWRDNPSAIAAPVLGATWPRSACIIKPFSNSFPIKVDFKPATGSRSMMPKSLQIARNTHFAWNVFSSQINKMWNMRWNKNQEMLQISVIIMTRRNKHHYFKCSCEILQAPRKRARWKSFPATVRSETMGLMITPGKLREKITSP